MAHTAGPEIDPNMPELLVPRSGDPNAPYRAGPEADPKSAYKDPELNGGGPEPTRREAKPDQEGSEARLFAVSDSAGFVGAFASTAAATAATVDKYPMVPFIVQEFPAAPGQQDMVWVVLYRALDAVAYVSNSRSAAEKVRGVYARVGLVYEDPLDYWEQPFGVVIPPAAARLEIQARVHAACAEQGGGRQQREDGVRFDWCPVPAPVSILDHVVPAALLRAGCMDRA